MAKGDQVEKKRLEVDGLELTGLVAMDEYVRESDIVEVPGRDSIVPVTNGVEKIPPIPATFKLQRNSPIYKYLSEWKASGEARNVTCIFTDGSGNEFRRELWQNTEVNRLHGPAYDASSPVFAQVSTQFLPEAIIDIDAE